MKKILFHFLALVLLWPAWVTAQAQSTPFTVLRNNTNIDTNYLYVEIMYERVPCDEHIAQFGVRNIDPNQFQTDTTWPIRIDSILNNEGTYELNGDTTLLMRPKAGGYKLRFKRADFPGDAATSDSILICVKSSRVPFFCKGCAAAYSDALFAPEVGKDIDPACPYNHTGDDYGDLLACYKRTSKAGNWEAWIRDERDCKPYRIVRMPDDTWWFAQNLEYTKGLTNAVTTDEPDKGTTVAAGYYWCPGSANFDSIAIGKPHPTDAGTTIISGGDTACHTYGALYTLVTALQADGIFPFDTTAMLGNTRDTSNRSRIRGICPKGWLVPNNVDWGMMFNYVHGCTANDITAGKRYCQHHKRNVSFKEDNQSPLISSRLRSTISSPRSIAHSVDHVGDSVTATKTRPDWSWTSRDANNPEYKKNRAYDAQDTYGFSMLPAGDRYRYSFPLLGKTAYFTASTFYGSGIMTTGGTGLMYIYCDSYNTTCGYGTTSGYRGRSVRCVNAQ